MGRTLFVAEIVGPDILIILAVVMLLFGSSKIPKLARSLGQASHEFRKGVSGIEDDAPPAPSAGAPSTTGQTTPVTNGVAAPVESGPAISGTGPTAASI